MKKKLTDYYFVYRYLGNEYTFTIPAESLDEALERRNQMGLARHEGILHKTIPWFGGRKWEFWK